MKKAAAVELHGKDLLFRAGEGVGRLPGGQIVIAEPSGKALCAIEPHGLVTYFEGYRPDEGARAFLSAAASVYAAHLKRQALEPPAPPAELAPTTDKSAEQVIAEHPSAELVTAPDGSALARVSVTTDNRAADTDAPPDSDPPA